MKIVAGGPAAVSVSWIDRLDVVTVNGLASKPATCTVPEKFSVTAGRVGAVTAGRPEELSSPLEHAPAASRLTPTTPRMRYFTRLLNDFSMTKGWQRPGVRLR